MIVCRRLFAPGVAGAILASAAGAQSGIPFSQQGGVSQRVAFTDISISYSRPTARGRVIYGDSAIVRWGRIWNPGADSASRVTFSRPVTFEGVALPAGTYSLWAIPRREGSWTMVLNSRGHVFHTPHPGEATDVLRVEVQPERGSHMESLAFYFPAVARDSTVLRFHWGDIMVPMRIRVSTEPQ
ncbi:MAG: DUF2911 domain-containing protein [Gemmatimonadota bacterium]